MTIEYNKDMWQYEIAPLEDGELDIIYNSNSENLVDINYKIGSLNFEYSDFDPKYLPTKEIKPLPLGWLPPMVRYLSNDHKTIVYERPPEFRTIQWSNKYKDQIQNIRDEDISRMSYEVLIPWQVFVVTLSHACEPICVDIYSRPSPIKNKKSPLYILPLPNIYGDASVCTPLISEMNVHTLANVGEALEIVYHIMWSSGFNYDLVNLVRMGLNHNFVKKAGNKIICSENQETKVLLQNWSTYVHNLHDINYISPGNNPNSIKSYYTVSNRFTVGRAILKSRQTAYDKFGLDINADYSSFLEAVSRYGNPASIKV